MSNAIILTKQSIREMQNVTREMMDDRIAAYEDAGFHLHWQSIEDECGDLDGHIVVPADAREAAFRSLQTCLVDNEIVVLFEENPATRRFEIWYTVAASDTMMEKMMLRSGYSSEREQRVDPEEDQAYREAGLRVGEPVYGSDLFLVRYGRQWW